MRKLFVLFVLAALPLSSLADAYQVEIGGLYYNLHDAVEVSETEGVSVSEAYAEVTNSGGNNYTGEITIPASVEYDGKKYPVTRVGNSAFRSCTEITSISFPTSLKTIGDDGFYDNYNLKLVDLPEGLTSIGHSAFGYVGNSVGGVKIVLPSTLTSIGDYAFQTNNTIEVVTSRIQTPFEINETVFSSSYSAVLIVPSGAKSAYQATAGWNLFDEIYEGEIGEASDGVLNYRYSVGEKTATVISGDYSELRSVTIPGSVNLDGTDYAVKAIGANAFRDCQLDTLVISSGVETIGNQAFLWNYNLKSLNFPATLKSIGNNAFDNCYQLQELVIPEGVTSISYGAFIYCRGLKKVELPSTLQSIGENAFWNIDNLSTVISHVTVPFEISKNVFATSSNGYENEAGEWIVTYTPSQATLYVPDGSKSAYHTIAGWNMFADIIEGELKEITVDGLNYSYVEGKGIATVTGRANEEITYIVIPATVSIGGANYSVKTIATGAFQNCTNIDTLVIQSGLETISKNAFQYCYNMKSITIPEGVKAIGENAFWENGVWSSGLKKLTLPSTLTSIGDNAFYRCNSLTIVTSRIATPFDIDKSVFATETNYYYDDSGNYVQDYVKSSATLYVPDGTKSAYQAIAGWNMFADIVEGELKETIVNGLIYSYLDGKGTATVTGRADEEMRNITIPGSVTINGANYIVKAVGAVAFESCGLDTLVIQEGVETIGNNAFRWNYDLKSLSLPSSLRTIGNDAFYDNYRLKVVELPEGLLSIGSSAFGYVGNYNSGVKIVLPSTLNSIGETAFQTNNTISNVTSRIRTPFEIKENVFGSTSAILYVPDGTKSAYQATAGWNVFADIVEGELKEATVDGLIYSYLDGKGVATVIGRENEEMHNIVIPSSVPINGFNYTIKSIAAGAFQSCGLDTLIIQDGVEIIGKDAFRENYNLMSLSLPSTLKTIGDAAFFSCSNVRNFSLPESVDSIGNGAFLNLNNLKWLVSYIKQPLNLGSTIFGECHSWGSDGRTVTYYNCTPSAATLYVPDGTKTAYQAVDGWNMFADIVEGDPKQITVDGLNYLYLDGKGVATVTGRADDNITDLVIPASIPVGSSTYAVTTIGGSAFDDCHSISTLSISNSIVSIGKYAFRNCYYLTEVIIPEGVQSIGEYAFENIGNWTGNTVKVTLPSTLTSIGDYAFHIDQPSKLSSVTSHIQTPFDISESVFAYNWTYDYSDGTEKRIFVKSNANLYVPEGTLSAYQAAKGWNMFAGVYEGELKEIVVGDLRYVYLPSTLTATVVAGDYSGLQEIVIPSTIHIEDVTYLVKEIGAGAFNDRYNIQKVTFNEGLEVIGNYAFRWCSNAEFSDFPSTLKIIGESAFRDCNRIEKLVLPEGVSSIGFESFGACSSMVKVTLPNSLASISERAFESCDNLTTVVSHIQNPFEIHNNVFGSLYNQEWDGQNGRYIEYYNPSPATLCVPEGTLARYKALEGWTLFSEIIEGEIIETVYGDLTYSYNTSSKLASVIKGENYSELKTVAIPSSIQVDNVQYIVNSISGRAFSSTGITSVTMAEGLQIIGMEAFSNCSSLTSISLPASVDSIAYNAFRNCYKLISIVVADENGRYSSSNSNVLIDKSQNLLMQGSVNGKIPDGITAIAEMSFYNMAIKSISIPGSVKSIGDHAFANCRSLTDVNLAEGIDSLANYAFEYCEKLDVIELPNSLKTINYYAFGNCYSLVNVVSNVETPKDINSSAFGDNDIYNRATLWVPRGKITTYKALEGWGRFELFDELLRDTLARPTITYNGRYMTMANDTAQRAKIYYSVDGSAPTILYSDTIALSNLGTILAISKRFGSYTVDTTRYEVTYVYDGVTARTASAGLLAKAFEWCSTDKVEMLDIAGTLNDDDFGTIRSLSKLTTLNMAASKMDNSTIPAGAFADMKLEWYVSPYTMASVGSNIFRGCNNLSAITWNSASVDLPEDVVTDVANPNMLVYAKAQAMIPYALKNVIVNGVANNITLADSAGNNNFKCPVEFMARRISYTHDYQQPTARGVTQGWETLALPFTVSKITHETQGELTPIAVEGAAKPFWLYELGQNGLEASTQIRANVPYLICMPNEDVFGDDYILGGRVTFSATNVAITTSGGITVSQGDRQFVPTYQSVAQSEGVYALNVGEAYSGNPMGSVFVPNYREVRPFEAYSVHENNRARIISLSTLGGGNATGINDIIQKDGDNTDAVVKVYSLSGALIKQGKREVVLRSLPKGLYIINGKKVIK